jgi:hypothetical protein
LFASLITRTQAEVASIAGEDCSVAISLTGKGGRENFDSTHQFLVQVSPEILRRFDRAEYRVGGPLHASVVLQRRRFPWTSRSVEEGVKLRVSAEAHVEPAVVEGAMRSLIVEVNRGYKPYWGPSTWSPQVLDRTVWLTRANIARKMLMFLLGAVLGSVVGLLLTRLYGGEAPGWGFAVVLPALLLPYLVDLAVPNIELAALGHTRAVILARRLIASSLAAVGPPLAAFLFG